MSVPYVAIVEPDEAWNPAVHQRRDLLPLSLEIEGRDSSVPTATMSVQNPNLAPSELSDKRVLISDRGRLIFDGVLEPAPIGLVDDVITLLANARPSVEEDLKAAMNALATPLKVSPYWEPLCVPQGQEEEWSEILAARTAVGAHSRIPGAPTVVEQLTGRGRIHSRHPAAIHDCPGAATRSARHASVSSRRRSRLNRSPPESRACS